MAVCTVKFGLQSASKPREEAAAAIWGTGPTRLASSECHDFTADHGSSSGENFCPLFGPFETSRRIYISRR
ncbi:unnamed protein product [Scomber scombrus]|uniref:Unnamed protein product n=1 Tax=Scomber scombrus TaxID=13677 RepID=A0AAV1MXB7_SCOSC